ncbi:MAG: peptidoglycan DD-metalloendopeptidase family protein [Alphaproteobacteria bacterium]
MASPATVIGYSVQPGDTVFGIGRRLSVPLRSIIDANALRPPYTLRTGQILRIPNPRKHVVAKGDTVYGIARKYRVNLTELVRLNHVPAPFTIALGQDLILPVTMRVQTRVATAVPPRAVITDTRPAVPPAAAVGSKSLSPAAQTAALRSLPAPVQPRQPAAIPVPPPRSGSTFLWPVRGKVVTSFGPRKGGLHNDGINIAAPRGTPVRAAENGVVAYVGNELRGFGNLVLVKHAGGWVTAYAHNDKLLVRRGDKVARGQTIAQVGSTGNVARPQLHFEIRKGARAVNPTKLLDRQSASLAN